MLQRPSLVASVDEAQTLPPHRSASGLLNLSFPAIRDALRPQRHYTGVMKRLIEISRPDPAWRRHFDELAAELYAAEKHLGDIEHVGSTAVPGLSAKPIIDVVIGVKDRISLPKLSAAYEGLGFQRGSPPSSQPNDLYMTREVCPMRPAAHLHLTCLGSPQWKALVEFRDRLRRDPALRAQYEALKWELATKSGGDLDSYTDGKSDFIAEAVREVVKHGC